MSDPRPGWLTPIFAGAAVTAPWLLLANTESGTWMIGALGIVAGASVCGAVRAYGTTAIHRGRVEAFEALTRPPEGRSWDDEP